MWCEITWIVMTAQRLKIVQLIILQSDLSNLFHRSCTTDSGEENLHWIQQNPKFKVSTSDFWPITAHAGLWRLLGWNNMLCILIGENILVAFYCRALWRNCRVQTLTDADLKWHNTALGASRYFQALLFWGFSVLKGRKGSWIWDKVFDLNLLWDIPMLEEGFIIMPNLIQLSWAAIS